MTSQIQWKLLWNKLSTSINIIIFIPSFAKSTNNNHALSHFWSHVIELCGKTTCLYLTKLLYRSGTVNSSTNPDKYWSITLKNLQLCPDSLLQSLLSVQTILKAFHLVTDLLSRWIFDGSPPSSSKTTNKFCVGFNQDLGTWYLQKKTENRLMTREEFIFVLKVQ